MGSFVRVERLTFFRMAFVSSAVTSMSTVRFLTHSAYSPLASVEKSWITSDVPGRSSLNLVSTG